MNQFFRLVSLQVGFVLCLSSAASAVDPAVLDPDTSYDELKDHLLKRYSPLVENFSKAEVINLKTIKVLGELEQAEVPAFDAWWSGPVAKSLSGLQAITDEDVNNLFVRALSHSAQIKVFGDLPLIRRTTIQEAGGQFDPRMFAQGRYADIDEPVGDELRTGGPERYLEDSSSINFGIRKKFLPGTEVALSQEFGRFDSNSIYLRPEEQGISRTGLTLTQPLLKGFGPQYNRTPEELAKVDYASSSSELRRQLEGHLLEIARAYWGLYMERSVALQKNRLATKTEEIYNKMKERVDIDIQPSLLARTKSQMLAHQLDADEAKFAILNAQSRIWTLVNDPGLASSEGLEFVTTQNPHHILPLETMGEVMEKALTNRPEIDQSIHQLRSAVLRYHRSRNEMLPELDLFVETYVKGLEGDYDHDEAWNESWDEGNPSVNFGLKFEYPLGNNGAEGRELRKRLEIRQLLHQLDTTVANILLEAQVSYREMIKNHMAMKRRYQVMQSTAEEIDALVNRIDVLIAANEEYGTILYQFLDAVERLNNAEIQFSSSELTYNLSLYQLKRAQGDLLNASDIRIEEREQDGLPVFDIHIAESDTSTQ